MNPFQRIVLLLIAVIFLVGCAAPPVIPNVVVAMHGDGAPRPTYILEVPGATATPTPFQPVPPTPVNLPPNAPTPTPTSLAEIIPTATVAPPVEDTIGQAALAQPFGQVNILLLGTDARPWDSNSRTDTIILVTLNSELGKVNMTSFPRDLYVTLPGKGMNRINTAYTYGKIKLLNKTFQHNFGITPDYYVLINFKAFKQVIDSLGGLTINVGKTLSDYRHGYWVKVPKGEVYMDADTVLWYVRSRKTTSDFGRNRRQQEVLRAIFKKMLSLNALRRLPEFYDLYKDNVQTDIGLFDLITWLPLAAKIAENGNLKQYYVSSNNVNNWITPGGAMVLLPKKEDLMRVIRKSQNIP